MRKNVQLISLKVCTGNMRKDLLVKPWRGTLLELVYIKKCMLFVMKKRMKQLKLNLLFLFISNIHLDLSLGRVSWIKQPLSSLGWKKQQSSTT